MRLIAFGSNLAGASGGPRAMLEAAAAAIEDAGVPVLRRSRWYASPACPLGTGPDYVNGAAVLGGCLDPAALLALLHDVEARLGRTRAERWEPRVCDLDLLAVDGRVLPDRATASAWIAMPPEAQRRGAPGALVLPHPRLHERAFVLVPLAEVAPDWVHPLLGRSVAEMLADLAPTARAEIAPL